MKAVGSYQHASESYLGRRSGGTFARPELRVCAEGLARLLDGGEAMTLDAREPGAYASGHIPGAVNLPPASMEWSVEVVPGQDVHHLLAPPDRIVPLLRASGLRLDRQVVVYDQGGSYLAARLFWILDYLGHPRPAVLDGGLAAWRSRGGQLTFEAADPAPGDFIPLPDRDKLADFEYVLSRAGSPGVRLCNALPADSFRREAIPGSRSLPFRDTFRGRRVPRLRTPRELAELLGRVASPTQELIVYCGVGYTASQDYWVARLLGYPRVRMYDGSLADWKARGGPLSAGGAPQSGHRGTRPREG